MNIIPVILAGGAGTRLWPLSRDDKPKQFHNLSGSGTLIEETISRLLPLKPEQCIIVTSIQYENLTRSEIKKSGIKGTILAEPRPRNTAAAVLYAAVYLDKLYNDSVMIVLPADHYITNKNSFVTILKKGLEQAKKGKLVAIGVIPAYPETGYGYIKALKDASGDAMTVDCFVEKPDIKKAKGYIESGNYYWNSGIYLWKTSTILESFEELMPELIKSFKPVRDMALEKIKSTDPDTWGIKQQVFDAMESISIDYGILERAKNRVVLAGDFGWADLGSWKSIDGILPPDKNENRTPDRENSVFVDSTKCSVFGESRRITVVGLSDVTVVEAGNNILVMNKESAQDIRKVVEIIKQKEK